MQDSYFVVEDMGVTFGVRLGGVDRVALYGHELRRKHSGPTPSLKLFFSKGVADGHGECGELCAAFIRGGAKIDIRMGGFSSGASAQKAGNLKLWKFVVLFRSTFANTACTIQTLRRRQGFGATVRPFWRKCCAEIPNCTGIFVKTSRIKVKYYGNRYEEFAYHTHVEYEVLRPAIQGITFL